ncbi:MAG: hypothetical protein E7447_08020 [Ruminococcaceae bacterium]|nr:hypothetical protein [Oscillospiraceae bacterium]
MQLRIKQRIFAWADTYDIFDEQGNAKYFVKGKVFSLGHQIHVFDKKTGKEVGSIHQKLLTFLPKYEIVIDGRLVGTITKSFTLWKPKYRVDFRDWEVEGDFWGWNYVARRGEYEVLRVSRELAWSDCYAINYINPADEIPALLLVLAIDAVNCDANNVDISVNMN